MQLHQLKPKHKTKNKKRVGRGGKRGTYSGRGCKGQKARAGRKMEPIIRALIKRYPKLKGYRAMPRPKNIIAINLGVLEKEIGEAQIVTPIILLEKKLIRRIKGKTPRVKILGAGSLSRALTFENCLVSKQAKEKIEKAGGKIK